jgi:hypothetical protein
MLDKVVTSYNIIVFGEFKEFSPEFDQTKYKMLRTLMEESFAELPFTTSVEPPSNGLLNPNNQQIQFPIFRLKNKGISIGFSSDRIKYKIETPDSMTIEQFCILVQPIIKKTTEELNLNYNRIGFTIELCGTGSETDFLEISKKIFQASLSPYDNTTLKEWHIRFVKKDFAKKENINILIDVNKSRFIRTQLSSGKDLFPGKDGSPKIRAYIDVNTISEVKTLRFDGEKTIELMLFFKDTIKKVLGGMGLA